MADTITKTGPVLTSTDGGFYAAGYAVDGTPYGWGMTPYAEAGWNYNVTSDRTPGGAMVVSLAFNPHAGPFQTQVKRSADYLADPRRLSSAYDSLVKGTTHGLDPNAANAEQFQRAVLGNMVALILTQAGKHPTWLASRPDFGRVVDGFHNIIPRGEVGVQPTAYARMTGLLDRL
jgi:hypothetical protein